MENTNLQNTDPDFTKKVELLKTKLYSRKPKTVEAILFCTANQPFIQQFLGNKFVTFDWVDTNGEPAIPRGGERLAVFFNMPMGQREDVEVSAIIEEDVLVKDENGVVVPMHWAEFVEEYERYKLKPTKLEAVQFGTTAEHLTAIRNLIGKDINISKDFTTDLPIGKITTPQGTLCVGLGDYIVKANNKIAVIDGKDYRKWRDGELDGVVYIPLPLDEIQGSGFATNARGGTA